MKLYGVKVTNVGKATISDGEGGITAGIEWRPLALRSHVTRIACRNDRHLSA